MWHNANLRQLICHIVGHDFGAWQAKTFFSGEQVRVCRRDGYQEKRTVPVTERIIEPYPFSFSTEGYDLQQPLLAFLRRVAPWLTADFTPPDTVFFHTERLGEYREEWLGDAKHGYKIECTTAYHPHWSYLAGCTVLVSAYGLPENYVLVLAFTETAIDSTTSSPRSSLTLQVNGPQAIVSAICAAFETEFASEKQRLPKFES